MPQENSSQEKELVNWTKLNSIMEKIRNMNKTTWMGGMLMLLSPL